ncbi:MAG: polysaccharide deacetylase family protein [Acidimicrobiales bacterium]
MRRTSALLGHPPIASFARRITKDSLRIVAYHDVPDDGAFKAQMVEFKRRYHVVDEAAVVDAVTNGGELPERSLWVTFDDGYPAVVERAQPVLDSLGIHATVYVCPGLVDTTIPQWTEVIREAQRRGVGPPQPVVEIKQLPDDERRQITADAATRLEEALGHPFTARQLTTQALEDWLASGHSVGNHTWDHPCLDRCSPTEQDRQIRQAHRWLTEDLGIERPSFAYPNGNRSDAAEASLDDLDYPIALLFDHQLTGLTGHRLRLSRLRLSSDAGIDRAEAIASGAHPMMFSLVNRARGVLR